jgi:hypothetical protein
MSYIVVLMSFTAIFPSIGYALTDTKTGTNFGILRKERKREYACMVYLYFVKVIVLNYSIKGGSYYFG